MNAKLVTVAAVAGLVLFSNGCGETQERSSGESSATGSSVTSTQTVATDATTQPMPATTTASAASWVMPNLVGMNLQEAQDAIQALTDHAVFFTSSRDATGQGRAQVLDSNWKVCSQSVRPGDAITATTKIEFATVKLDERCP